MSLNLDSVLQTFIVEARELMQEMEDSLLRLEGDSESPDIIGAIFRAAHTIKGSAGLFGLSPIVGFTHIVEDVLDRVRDGHVRVDGTLIAVLLESRDHMQNLVETVAANGQDPSPDMQAVGEGLIARLQPYRTQAAQHNAPAAPANTAHNTTQQQGDIENTCWHISIRFASDVLAHGMDPSSILSYLGTLGDIVNVFSMADSLPEFEQFDPEQCYWGYEIALRSNAERADIASAFEFIEENSIIKIVPPKSKLADYIELINALPENNQRVGEILVAVGALTEQEVLCALANQTVHSFTQAEPAPLGEILMQTQGTPPELIDQALSKQNSPTPAKENNKEANKESVYVRVHAEKLDHLINLVGELVIAGAGANLLAKTCNNNALAESTSNISDLVEEIRDGALKLRMVPIGDTFNRFHRVVRDVSRDLEKDIELRISGADTELDKTVVEKIGDPLMHLVRNAMDHGLETPEARLAAGKPVKGELHLNAYHDSGSIVIEISDDGKGLDKDRILAKAQEKGLVAPGVVLSDSEIFNLIFEPGFSTAAAITNLSGRGVGMDVVKKNITALRGTVELESETGQGATVRIRLPLTLAIIDGFLVEVGHSSYVIPLDLVKECIELSEEEQRNMNERHYINLRGEVLPLVFLRQHFMVEEQCSRRSNVVVVQANDRKAGLVVDELQGEFQTVIKPLGKLFSALRGIGGSTILGTGSVALILDIPSLISEVNRLEPSVSVKAPSAAC